MIITQKDHQSWTAREKIQAEYEMVHAIAEPQWPAIHARIENILKDNPEPPVAAYRIYMDIIKPLRVPIVGMTMIIVGIISLLLAVLGFPLWGSVWIGIGIVLVSRSFFVNRTTKLKAIGKQEQLQRLLDALPYKEEE